MKIKYIIAFIIIILVAGYAYFGIGIMKERGEQAALTSQITSASDILAQVQEPPQDLEQRLTAIQASLAAEEDAFPGKTNSTQIINTILTVADGSDIKAIPLVTQPWATEKVGEHNYYVFRLNISARGTFSQLLSFTSKLETGGYKTLILEDLNVSRESSQAEDGNIPMGDIPVVADLDLAIYTSTHTSD